LLIGQQKNTPRLVRIIKCAAEVRKILDAGYESEASNSAAL
jgi:hypothetical protein